MRKTFTALMLLAIVAVSAGCKKTEIDTKSDGIVSGHNYVDLGLPSGILWASCNIGALVPEGYGNYYAWGETTPQRNNAYNENSYKFFDGNNYTKYNFTDGLTTLRSPDDAAAANWGNGWRMPTADDWDELLYYCDVDWIEQNGTYGRLITGPNNHSIFLPAAGCRLEGDLYYTDLFSLYWSSTLLDDDEEDAWYLYISETDCNVYYNHRYYGHPVRPVYVPTKK